MMINNLDVFIEKVKIGTLHNSEPISFSYTQDCLSGLIEVPFSGIIPLKSGPINSIEVTAFFENLLPEGDQRAIIESSHHVSTVFGLLSAVGGDTAGSIVILPEGTTPQPNNYLPVTWNDIRSIINNTESLTPEVAAAVDSNTSLSGAQNKILLSISDSGSPLLPLNSSISTHILKPEIKRSDMRIWGSSINETLVMTLADLCQIPTASVKYIPGAKSCMVERYDRELDKSGELKRLYQADLCQLLNKPSTVKYQNDGGPSFYDCYVKLKSKSSVPIIDCANLLKWLIFNLMIGNNDSHAKNISMISIGGKLRLAPFYDLMCTRVYSGLSPNFAFKIGEHYQANLIDHNDINELSKSLGVSARYMSNLISDVVNSIKENLPIAVTAISEGLEHTDLIMVSRIENEIKGIVKKTVNRLIPKQSIDATESSVTHQFKPEIATGEQVEREVVNEEPDNTETPSTPDKRFGR